MKKFALLILMAVLVLGLIASVVVARGPANKATGSVWLDHPGKDDPDRYIEFDAHEAKDENGDAKGTVCWYQQWDDVSPTFIFNVVCVNVVDNNTVRFAAGPGTKGYLVFEVVDGGTPGVNNDALSLQWVLGFDDACTMVGSDTLLDTVYIITGGNLVVHFYGVEE